MVILKLKRIDFTTLKVVIKLNGCIFCFLIKDDDLLRKYNTIWDKGSTDIKTKFDSKFFYKKNCWKPNKILWWWGYTDFHDKEIHKVASDYMSLAVIRINSALKKDESYYPQVLLKECKYI